MSKIGKRELKKSKTVAIAADNLNVEHAQGEEERVFAVDDLTEYKSEAKDIYSRELRFIEAELHKNDKRD